LDQGGRKEKRKRGRRGAKEGLGPSGGKNGDYQTKNRRSRRSITRAYGFLTGSKPGARQREGVEVGLREIDPHRPFRGGSMAIHNHYQKPVASPNLSRTGEGKDQANGKREYKRGAKQKKKKEGKKKTPGVPDFNQKGRKVTMGGIRVSGRGGGGDIVGGITNLANHLGQPGDEMEQLRLPEQQQPKQDMIKAGPEEVGWRTVCGRKVLQERTNVVVRSPEKHTRQRGTLPHRPGVILTTRARVIVVAFFLQTNVVRRTERDRGVTKGKRRGILLMEVWGSVRLHGKNLKAWNPGKGPNDRYGGGHLGPLTERIKCAVKKRRKGHTRQKRSPLEGVGSTV